MVSAIPPFLVFTPPPPPRPRRSKQALFNAAGLVGAGLLLHQLPARTSAFKVPTDWKVWASVALGIAATRQVNQATGWQPRPALAATETVALLTPMLHGFTPRALAMGTLTAPLVAGLSETATWVNRRVANPVAQQLQLPDWLPKLAVAGGLLWGGSKLTSAVFKRAQQWGAFGKLLAPGAFAGGITCARGCTPGGVICLSELGEWLGGAGGWFHRSQQQEQGDVSTQT